MNDQIYRRAMGLPYSQSGREREISNYGVSEKAGNMVYDRFGNAVWPNTEVVAHEERVEDAPVEVRVEAVSKRLLGFENEMSRTGFLTRGELKPTMAEIDRLCAEFSEQLKDMEVEDELFSKGIQEWAQNARELFAEEREGTLSDDDRLLEDVKIYEAMVAELESDGEDRTLIDIANACRYQAIAQLSAAQIKELYEQAA